MLSCRVVSLQLITTTIPVVVAVCASQGNKEPEPNQPTQTNAHPKKKHTHTQPCPSSKFRRFRSLPLLLALVLVLLLFLLFLSFPTLPFPSAYFLLPNNPPHPFPPAPVFGPPTRNRDFLMCRRVSTWSRDSVVPSHERVGEF